MSERRYSRAVRAAFREVTFYRSQCAAAGRMLPEPMPTPTSAVPDPPHELCPFRRPWRPDRELPLGTPDPRQLVAALRIARLLPAGGTVLDVGRALVDRPRLSRRVRFGILLDGDALAADRRRTNAATLAAAEPPVLLVAPPGWPDPGTVPRAEIAAVADGSAPGGPLLVRDPVLGYLGARHPQCGRLHTDPRLVHVADRGGVLAFSLVRRRRPTLLAMVPPGADGLRLTACPRHGTPVFESLTGPR